MHQTAQRIPLAAKTAYRVADQRQGLQSDANKSDANSRAVAAACAIRSGTAGAKPSPYQPDHQVELLHLQAEADALMVKLQAAGQRQVVSL